MSEDLLERTKNALQENLSPNSNTAGNDISNTTKKVAAAWLASDTDFETIQKVEPDEEIVESEIEKDKPEPKNPETKSTKESQEASAETMTGIMDLAINSIFLPIELYRYKNSFKGYDWKEVKAIVHEDRATLTPEKQLLFDRVSRGQKKFKERKDEIQMSVDELEAKKRAFMGYYKATGKELSPEFLFWGNVIMGFGDRITGTLMDDGY